MDLNSVVSGMADHPVLHSRTDLCHVQERASPSFTIQALVLYCDVGCKWPLYLSAFRNDCQLDVFFLQRTRVS